MKETKTKGKTKPTLEQIRNAKTVEEAQELLDEYFQSSQNIYVQVFTGNNNVESNKQSGKPNPPY